MRQTMRRYGAITVSGFYRKGGRSPHPVSYPCIKEVQGTPLQLTGSR